MTLHCQPLCGIGTWGGRNGICIQALTLLWASPVTRLQWAGQAVPFWTVFFRKAAGSWPAGLFHHHGNSQQWNPDKLTGPFFHPHCYEKHLLGGLAGDRAAEIPQLNLQRIPCELLQGTW